MWRSQTMPSFPEKDNWGIVLFLKIAKLANRQTDSTRKLVSGWGSWAVSQLYSLVLVGTEGLGPPTLSV